MTHKTKLQYDNNVNDQWLHHLPLEHPQLNFTDRVMEELVAGRYIASDEYPAETSAFHFRREFFHGLTAAISTYLFIQTGVMDKIMKLDIAINQLLHFIEHLSR